MPEPHPHATLARLHRDASPGFASEWLRRHRAWEGPPFHATSFGLYTSQLTPTGAVHTRLREYPLALFDGVVRNEALNTLKYLVKAHALVKRHLKEGRGIGG